MSAVSTGSQLVTAAWLREHLGDDDLVEGVSRIQKLLAETQD